MQRFSISNLERLPAHTREVVVNRLEIDYIKSTVTLAVTVLHLLGGVEDKYIAPVSVELKAAMDNYVDSQGLPVVVVRQEGDLLPEGVMPEFVFLDTIVGAALMPIIQGAIMKADMMGRFL